MNWLFFIIHQNGCHLNRFNSVHRPSDKWELFVLILIQFEGGSIAVAQISLQLQKELNRNTQSSHGVYVSFKEFFTWRSGERKKFLAKQNKKLSHISVIIWGSHMKLSFREIDQQTID